jgi:hypothetical protein
MLNFTMIACEVHDSLQLFVQSLFVLFGQSQPYFAHYQQMLAHEQESFQEIVLNLSQLLLLNVNRSRTLQSKHAS